MIKNEILQGYIEGSISLKDIQAMYDFKYKQDVLRYLDRHYPEIKKQKRKYQFQLEQRLKTWLDLGIPLEIMIQYESHFNQMSNMTLRTKIYRLMKQHSIQTYLPVVSLKKAIKHYWRLRVREKLISHIENNERFYVSQVARDLNLNYNFVARVKYLMFDVPPYHFKDQSEYIYDVYSYVEKIGIFYHRHGCDFDILCECYDYDRQTLAMIVELVNHFFDAIDKSNET